MTEGLHLKQLQVYVVVPVLQQLGLYSKAAERLVMATGLVESHYRYIDQIERGGDKRPGPARGLWQMEAATHKDIWDNYLQHQPELAGQVSQFLFGGLKPLEQLHGNLYYGAAMCRVHYRRKSRPLPDADDLKGLARYWKDFYNTIYGAGTVEGFMQKAAPVMEL